MRLALLLISLFISQLSYGSAVIFSGNDVKALRQNIDLNSIAKVLTGTDNPTVTAKNAPQGSIYLRTGASGGTAYLKQDAGNTTNWLQLGSTGTIGDPNIVTKSASATLLTTENIVIANTSSGAFTLTMPNCDTSGDKQYEIKLIGSNTLTLTQDGNDQFDETDSDYYLSDPGSSVKVVCEGGFYYAL